MTFPARKLVSNSLYLSTVVSREFQSPSGDEITIGLDLLNALLDLESGAYQLIPYYKRDFFNLIPGVEDYFIPNLFDLSTCAFFIAPGVRFALNRQYRQEFFGNSRITNIDSIPLEFHTERELGGTRIYFYFEPNEDYQVEITGKYGLTDVDLDTDLLTVYDKFYIEYLRWALANYMCLEYDISFGREKSAQLSSIIKKLKWVSPPDFTTKKRKMAGGSRSFNWYVSNISQGWWPE